MSEKLEQARAILGDWAFQRYHHQITTCDCGVPADPDIVELEGGRRDMYLSATCPECAAYELDWVQTHCHWCEREMPRKQITQWERQFCDAPKCQEIRNI